ncbi:MAG: hypothetical protein CBARDCOR_0849 [uncultured Caballeronia sp.]|nr:MAG: hypothetical protein CBARDCOR_0849 [uncultured Caballeronia sp.]
MLHADGGRRVVDGRIRRRRDRLAGCRREPRRRRHPGSARAMNGPQHRSRLRCPDRP